MSSAVQIRALEDIARSAARAIQRVIAIQDVDTNTAAALNEIANSLQRAPSYAQQFSEAPVPASTHEHSHDTRIHPG